MKFDLSHWLKGKKLIWLSLGVGYAITFTLIGCAHFAKPKRQHTQRSLSGAQLYQTYCLTCHGEQAQGRGSIPNLTRSKLSLDQFAQKLRIQGKAMPSYKEVLFDTDYQPLYQYLQQLKK